MTRNPYAPPESTVVDIVSAPSASGGRTHVVRACTLLWWSFGVAALGSVLNLARQPEAFLVVAGLVGIVIGGAIGFFIVLWQTTKLRAGRNWMRLLITVLHVGGILAIPIFWRFLRPYFLQYLAQPVSGVFALVQWVLILSAVVLINTPNARAWFAAQKEVVRSAA
jgi:hypothetical protein